MKNAQEQAAWIWPGWCLPCRGGPALTTMVEEQPRVRGELTQRSGYVEDLGDCPLGRCQDQTRSLHVYAAWAEILRQQARRR